MDNYILELLNHGLWIFPIAGKGKNIDQAKQPLSFCKLEKYIECRELIRKTDREVVEKYKEKAKRKRKSLCELLCEEYYRGEYVTWKHKEILNITRLYAQKGHNAWALWLLGSKKFGIDIDLYRSREPNVKYLLRKLTSELRSIHDFYSEVSARGGLHIITSVDAEEVLQLNSNYKWIEYKHDGYFIIYPSELRTPGRIYKYQRLGGSLLYTCNYTDAIPIISGLLSKILGKMVTLQTISREKHAKKQTAEGEAEDVESDPKRRRPKLVDYGIFSKIKREFTELQPWPHVVVAVGLLAVETGCRGFAEILDKWTETGKIPIKYEMLPNNRGSHRTFESVLFVLLRELGYPVEKAEKIAEKINYTDGVNSTDPSASVVYRYDHQSIIPLNKMSCPYGDIGKCWCASKPDWRIINWIKRYPEQALRIIRYVKRLNF